MFEFSVARKYLTPRWRQLSVSIISMISMLVIALVVWLIVVFFSVTNGLEQRWVQKLTAVTAPVRVIPTQDYYSSYYYLVDSIAAASEYSLKTIAEKRDTYNGDPYDPAIDEEVPFFWLAADHNENNELKDIVGGAFESIAEAGNYHANVYEVTGANVKLKLLRLQDTVPSEATLSQTAYVASLDKEGAQMDRTLMPHQLEDIENFYYLLGLAEQSISDGSTESFAWVYPEILQDRLARFYATAKVTQLKTPEFGWRAPPIFFRGTQTWKAIAINEGLPSHRILVPTKENAIPEIIAELQKQGYQAKSITLDGQTITPDIPIYLPQDVHFKSEIETDSIARAQRPTDVVFRLSTLIQKKPIAGSAVMGSLRFADVVLAKANPESPMWIHRDTKGQLVLGSDLLPGEAVVLPRTFHDVGVRLGDRGYVSFYTPTASTIQEQRLPVYIAGFYDPGIVPTSGKLILTNPEMTSMIRSSHETENNATTNGINVHFDDIAKADQVKAQIEAQLKKRGIDRYWTVETYREFEFTKPLLDQLQSDKTLFLLISTVIIIVACSNIISMLIIMVNDKKMEIGIMRAMGSSAFSIATIFGLCGVMMGMIGSFFGISLAVLTLKNMDSLVKLLSTLQGHNAFNPLYYGDSLPTDISFEALVFVILVTGLLSLLAGIVPAIKASMLKPSAILRSE
jgi:lipoprotein-releasing system permease protein